MDMGGEEDHPNSATRSAEGSGCKIKRDGRQEDQQQQQKKGREGRRKKRTKKKRKSRAKGGHPKLLL